MPDIFLSYTRDDQDIARRFAEAFEREQFSVWWDATLRSGEAYDEVTEKALREAKAVIVLWSKKSAVSRWVRAEATLADRNRTLVPAMIEPCERPIMFELTQTADLTRWTGDSADRAWQAFLADVRRFIGTDITATSTQPALQVSSSAPAAPAQPKDHRPSLAILPFTNRSGEAADDVFADGMVEDLIGALSLTRAMKVIAYSSTIVYRKNVSDVRAIGRALGVRYLLEGNVRRVGTALRVTAQLVEPETGAILWMQKFDRPLSELAELQEQLATEVASHLGVQVERIEMENVLKKPGDLTAWESLMRARSAYGRLNLASIRTAIEDARRAVAIAPDYALAHAVLTNYLGALYLITGGLDKSLEREGRFHAERALALDSQDATVLGSISLALGYFGSWHEALAHAERAVHLNPNLSGCHSQLALIYIHFRRPDDVHRHVNAALVLAPRGHNHYLALAYRGMAYFMAGRYEEALQTVEQSLLLFPHSHVLRDKAVFCEKLGQHEAARDAVRRLRVAEPTLTLEILARSHALLFDPVTAADLDATLRKVWLETPMDATTG